MPRRLIRLQVVMLLGKHQELLKLLTLPNQRVLLEALVQVVVKKRTRKSFLHSLH
jgi:hypothetical protein